MKYRSIILTTIRSLLVCGGLARTALAGPDVTVVNTTANPVPITGTVTDADNPARNAVQMEIIVNPGSTTSSVTIPAGKIFVIEFVSFIASGATVESLELGITGPNIIGGNPIELTYQLVPTPPNALVLSVGNQALRLYAQPGTNVVVAFTSSDNNQHSGVEVSLSGYLVNAQ